MNFLSMRTNVPPATFYRPLLENLWGVFAAEPSGATMFVALTEPLMVQVIGLSHLLNLELVEVAS